MKTLFSVMERKMMSKEGALYLYETIERIVRFDIHLDEIQSQFYVDNSNKKALVGDFKYYLKRLFGWILSIKDDANNLVENLKNANDLINELHQDYLSILPRPSVPVELTRFERVIRKQIVALKNENSLGVSISTNESVGENTENDPLSQFWENFAKKVSLQVEKPHNKEEKYPISITVPRIEASNTFRWPSLIHEMCHHLMGSIKFETNVSDISSDFLSFVGTDQNDQTIFNSFFGEQIEENGYIPSLSDWLTECFCDLFACLLIGPSFYFSQFVVFLYTCGQDKFEKHPPHSFRLGLIESVISHRFKDLYDKLLSQPIEICNDLLDKTQKDCKLSIYKRKDINNIFSAFNEYFLTLFLNNSSVKGNPDINKRFKEIVDRYVTIQTNVLNSLTSRLKEGLPIPSIRTCGENEKYEEIPTYVQEILLTSWLVKLKDFPDREDKDGLVSKVMNIIVTTSHDNQEQIYDDIRNIVVRHDKAVLKSIQVSEWFDMLTDEKKRSSEVKVFETKNKPTDENLLQRGVLVDSEIYDLITQDELKIIPLMYSGQIINDKERTQMGTTSIDIRLGTSFQVFSPHQSGIIDFITQEGENFFKESSKRIDLDFMESITIAPGQFILGHSMEYVNLPNHICGNLEGRSSFARLGLEIHMTAGFIDPGFEGVITFEIYNAGPTTIKLYPGMRIGQLRLERNNEPERTYGKKEVKYKGLLEHNLSLQSKDVEVELIRKYKSKQLL